MVRWLTSKNRSRNTQQTRRPRKDRVSLFLQPLEVRVVPATYTVNNNLDANSGILLTGDLRYCINQANLSPGADTIVFSLGVADTININSGTDLLITDDLSIDGFNSASVTLNGSISRIFNVDNSLASRITVDLDNLTLQNGQGNSGPTKGGNILMGNEILTLTNVIITGGGAASGGGIAVSGLPGGSLSLENCAVNNNTAASATLGGGGIYLDTNAASLSLLNTTLDGNFAINNGGGIYFNGFGVALSIVGSTISNNIASSNTGGGGGGMWFAGSFIGQTALIKNTTIFGNAANGASQVGQGGGISFGSVSTAIVNSTYSFTAGSAFFGDVRIENSTIMNNFVGTNVGQARGGGILLGRGAGSLTVVSSIIANNTATADPQDGSDIFGRFAPVGVSNSAIGTSGGFTRTDNGGNLAFGANLHMDVSLGANGGPTQTVRPLDNSPVINKGSGAGTDQTGAGRVFGSAADVGSYELQSTPTAPFSNATLNAPVSGSTTYAITVIYTANAGMDTMTIQGSDVTLTGPGGYNSPANAGPAIVGPAGSTTVTYVFPAPDNLTLGTWDYSDTGSYSLTMTGAISDLGANSLPNDQLGVVDVAIGQNFLVDLNSSNGSISSATSGDIVYVLNLANADPNTPDTITFSASHSITLTGASLNVTGPVTIDGQANLVTISGGGTFRIFDVNGTNGKNNPLSLANLTLTGGQTNNASTVTLTQKGGAIRSLHDSVNLSNVTVTLNNTFNDGTIYTQGGVLTVSNSLLSGNTASTSLVATPPNADGGAIYANNTRLIMTNTTVSGNSAFSGGGGIYGVNSFISIVSSTLSGNTAFGSNNLTYSGGGGLYVNGSANQVSIVNSTISGNTARFNGGGILFRSSLQYNSFSIINSTITANRALSINTGSGLSGFGGGGLATVRLNSNVLIESTIISGNQAVLYPDLAVTGSVTLKNSALGSTNGVGRLTQIGTNLFGQDLKLGALADNGGPTKTHLPGFGSPLINAGNAGAGVTLDQTGGARSQGGGVDIGSVESPGVEAVAVVAPFADVTAGGAGTYDVVINFRNNGAMDTTTFDNSDVTVNGVSTTFSGYNSGTGNATYTFAAPGGSFDATDNNTFNVALLPNAVRNAALNFVNASDLGAIRVRIYTVLNNNDAGAGSLRQNVLDSNFWPGADTITFDPTVFGGANTISLTSGALNITDSLSLVGPGYINPNDFTPANLKLTIDAGGLSRVFNVDDGVNGRFLPVSISGLRMNNGNANGAATVPLRGGAIIIADEPTTLTDVAVTGSVGPAGGGGIAVNAQGGKLTLNRVTVSGNTGSTATAILGGGIRITTNCSLVMTDSVVTNNVSFHGGGIASLTGQVLIERSTISGNTAISSATTGAGATYGGGAYFGGGSFEGNVVIRNSTFFGNLASTNTTIKASASGGAIGMPGGAVKVTLQNVTVTGNTVTSGLAASPGGGGIRIATAQPVVTLESTIVAGNFHTTIAGGVAPTNPGPDLASSVGSRYFSRHSLIGALPASGQGLVFVDQGNNFTGTVATPVDPGLDTAGLNANGQDPGEPQTVAITSATSKAIDNGSNPAGLVTDQRGAARTTGVRTDIGAYEYTLIDLPVADTTGLPATVTALGGASTFTITVTFADQSALDLTSMKQNNLLLNGPGVVNDIPIGDPVVTGSSTLAQAVYTFNTPGGGWALANNGTFVVTLVNNTVDDMAGNPVTAIDLAIGSFNVAIGQKYTVTSTADTNTAGTLRFAIGQANLAALTNVPTFDTIQFDDTGTFSTAQTITLTSALPTINDGVAIVNPSGIRTRVTINGADSFRLFNVSGPMEFNVSFASLTLTKGTGQGGAVQTTDENVSFEDCLITANLGNGVNNGSSTVVVNGAAINATDGGDITITNSTLSNNTVGGGGRGAGIFTTRNSSAITIDRSTVSGNSQINPQGGATNGAGGGGLLTYYGGSILIKDSTFTSNKASSGPAMTIQSRIGPGGFVIQNSTFTGNSASGSAGAIFFNNTFQGGGSGGDIAYIRNSTITGNTSTSASATPGYGSGGIARVGANTSSGGTGSSRLQLDSTILAFNLLATSIPFAPAASATTDLSSPQVFLGNNNFLGSTDATPFPLFGQTNILGGNKLAQINPKLGALASNGGPTQTMLPLAGSPVINTGSNPAGLVNDQRGVGFNRVGGVAADIGAVEVLTGNPITAVVTFAGDPAYPNQRSVIRAIVVTFSEMPNYQGSVNSSFQVTRLGTSVSPGPTGNVPLNTVATSGNSATITFSDSAFAPAATQGGSLIDGQYVVTVFGTSVAGLGGFLDGNMNLVGGDDLPTSFFRLYGDSNGDMLTNLTDFGQFRVNFSPNFNTIFDYNNDGLVNLTDFGQFRAHFFPFAP